MSPVFAHGQLRLYLLVLIAEAPRHGYEVIQELEQRFGGLYTPSAGTVYPRLAKLEDEGLVARADEGRKATYSITESGMAEVQARHSEVQELQADLDQSARRLAEQVRATVQGRSADLRAELKAAARQARSTARPPGADDADPAASAGPWPWGWANEWTADQDDPRGADTRWDDPRGADTRWDAPRGADTRWDAPQPGPFRGREHGRGADEDSGGRDWADLERAAYDLRRQARRAWREHGLTGEQTSDLIEILADASQRISDVLRRGRR